MPISLPNFLNVPAQDYGAGDILGGLTQGYAASRLPRQIGLEEQKAQLANILLGHQGVNEGIKSRYLPQEYEANIANTRSLSRLHGTQSDANEIANKLERLYGEKNYLSQLNSRDAITRGHILENNLTERYGAQEKQALIDKLKKEARYGNLTATQKDAIAAGFLPGSKEYEDIMRGSLGVFAPPLDARGNPLTVPKNAIPLVGKNANERGDYEKEMRKNVERGEAARLANFALDEIISITDRYPKLNRSLSFILSDPEFKNPKTMDRALRGLNEEEQTQLDLLSKYSQQLVLSQSEAGNARGTDRLRNLIALSKPGVQMTDAARKKIAGELKRHNLPLIRYADEASPFIGSYYIPYQAKNYEREEDYNDVEKLSNKINGNDELKAIEDELAEINKKLSGTK